VARSVDSHVSAVMTCGVAIGARSCVAGKIYEVHTTEKEIKFVLRKLYQSAIKFAGLSCFAVGKPPSAVDHREIRLLPN